MIDDLTCFKSYDVRGDLTKNFDPRICYRIARSFAMFLQAQKVVVGRDARESSPKLLDSICKGLMDEGVEVLDIGLAGTEEMYWATTEYEASGGIEYHIMMNAFDDSFFDSFVYELFKIWSYIHNFIFEKKLYWSNLKNYTKNFGFLRLRIDKNPGGDIIPEINNTALIREVHVYGNSLGVGSSNKSSQHRGYGQLMMLVAEDIAKENGFYKTSVIAGIGTREYYKNKCGYSLIGEYMIKDLKDDRFIKLIFKLSILILILSWIITFF